MIYLDFETFSEADLTKTGLSRYAEDPSTEVLCLSWAIDNGEPDLWIPGQPPPHRLFDPLPHHYLSAFNAQFEIKIWEEVCVKRMGWPPAPVDRWLDTQADALAIGLPAKLDQCAKALGLPPKDKRGKALINKLCKLVKPTKKHPSTRWLKSEAHEDFLALYAYCKQDVRVERSVAAALPYRVTAPGHLERPVWLETVCMNFAGIPIDVPLVDRLIDLIAQKVGILTQRIREITRDPELNITQKAVIQRFINEAYGGSILSNMQGLTIQELLDRKILPPALQELLFCYAQANYTSIKKFAKMKMQLCKDGTIKDNLRYHGAGTGRDSGMGVQMQNLPRASVDDPEFVIECVHDYSLETIEALFGNVLELSAALIRSAIKAPEGFTFFNADFKQIEWWMCAWIAREKDILEGFRRGEDPYSTLASKMYHIPYESIDKKQRQAGKIGGLACQFQGASAALLGMAKNYGIIFEQDEAQEIVNAFRAARLKLRQTWKAFGAAAIEAILNPGHRCNVATNPIFSFVFNGGHLFMRFPDGKILCFPFAKYEMWMMPWGKKQMSVTHMWVNNMPGGNHRWERRGISGASLMQSAVQGLSGRLLMQGNLRLVEQGYDVRWRVHDELTAIVPDDASSNLKHFTRVFTELPEWAEGLPVEADPWEGRRYKK